jgi:hypothetical protein
MRAYRRSSGLVTQRGRRGQFRKTNMGDFGLKTLVCKACKRINPFGLLGAVPTTCHACGSTELV